MKITTGAMRSGGGIFAINFALGVVTGIPNGISVWNELGVVFSIVGRVIGQTLAMEVCFRFFWSRAFSA